VAPRYNTIDINEDIQLVELAYWLYQFTLYFSTTVSFLLLDVMHSTVLAVFWCPSVYPSVTLPLSCVVSKQLTPWGGNLEMAHCRTLIGSRNNTISNRIISDDLH